MVSITKNQENFIFEVNGMHKLWSFKSQITIPSNNILSAHQDFESIKGWKGWKSMGTSFPNLITAGTFIKDGKKIFWDVSEIENCIIVELKDQEFSQLIIEVKDPEKSIKLLAEN